MKKNILKYILITILVIILCLIFLVGKKVTIISKLDKRVCYYEDNKDNIYLKLVNKTVIDEEDEEIQSTIEFFTKDNIEKFVNSINRNDEITKIIQMTYPTERKNFYEAGNEKTLTIYQKTPSKRTTDVNSAESTHTSIPNYAHCANFMELILAALTTDIKFTQANGKLCYELSSKNSPLFIYNENSLGISAYLEKDTGLPLKLVEEFEENGKKVEYVTDCEVKFDCVTDADIAEPNIAEYKLQEQ